MRCAGIDFGTGKVGVALSDEAGAMGFPHAVFKNDQALIKELAALFSAQKVGMVVIGESRDFSGAENPVAKEARAFGDRLHEATGLPVEYEMEILTTQEARRDLEGNRTRTRDVDAAAAALILTSYITRRQQAGGREQADS